MSDEQQPSREVPPHRAVSAATRRWAPWWVYVFVILGGNYLRQAVLPYGTVPEWVDVVLALVLAAVLFALVTAVYRTVVPRRDNDRGSTP